MSNSVAVTVKHYAKCNGVFAAELFQEKNGAWRAVVDFTDGSPAVTLTHPMRLGIENSKGPGHPRSVFPNYGRGQATLQRVIRGTGEGQLSRRKSFPQRP